MSKKRNEQRRLALQELVGRFERNLARQEPSFFAEEQFEELLNHYFERGDFDRTLYVADLAISQHRYTPEFYKWKALIHKIHLEEEEAMETLEQLAIYAPNDEEALLLRLEVYVHFEKNEAAKELLDTLHNRVDSDLKRGMLHYFDGLILLQQGHVEASWAALTEAVTLDPYQEPALDEMLNANEFSHLRPSFNGILLRLVNDDPFNHLAWFYLGLWYDDYGQDYKATDAFAYARALNEREPRYELDYADKLFDLNRFDAALRCYDRYFNFPDAEGSYETHMRVGRSHQMLDDLDKARAAYFKASEADPGMFDTYQYLGECYAAEGKWSQAIHNYTRATELPNHTAECWLGLGLCYSALNEFAAAEEAYGKAISLEPRYSDAIVSYAIFLADNGQEQNALTMMSGYLEEYEDASLLYGMVAVCLISNRRSRALEYLNEALAGFFDDREMLLEWYPNLREDREVDAIFKLYEI